MNGPSDNRSPLKGEPQTYTCALFLQEENQFLLWEVLNKKKVGTEMLKHSSWKLITLMEKTQMFVYTFADRKV